jgi:hypothetical protein
VSIWLRMERGLPGVIERGGCSLRPARPPERRKRSFVRCGGYECTEFFSCEEEEKEGDMREVLCPARCGSDSLPPASLPGLGRASLPLRTLFLSGC